MPAAVLALPSASARAADDWRTSDLEEINRRKQRAHEEAPRIVNCDPRFPVYSDFEVHSPSGVTYVVEIRDLTERQWSCECVDFRVNGLGTCKHVEALFDFFSRAQPAAYAAAQNEGSPRIDLVPDRPAQTLRVERNLERLPKTLRRLFDREGRLAGGYLPEMALELWKSAPTPELRLSQEVGMWLECRRREAEGLLLRRTYELNVQSGAWPAQETLLPLFPYQREGMLHLACAERALLADEMGLGKTAQAVAACALLHRLGRAQRVLVVTPASLQSEWAEQIARFTRLSCQQVGGNRPERLAAYARGHAPFFTLANYDVMPTDVLEINERLQPEIVILDEAQRIRNWDTKTALAVKRLRSRYAWVLTGNPVENRIDELYSLVSFLDPEVFGPLFRFNREFYEFDERGRPTGYRNLDVLRTRVRPLLLRRRKADVQSELPHRIERTYLVPLSDGQRTAYRAHEAVVARLLAAQRRRPLTGAQRDRLQNEMQLLRMACDSTYLLGARERDCPKAEELARLLPECMGNPEVKVLIFSEWEKMLELAGDVCRRLRIDCTSHTGNLSPAARKQNLQRFRTDPNCRVLLSTDTGAQGLNLQHASVVIHCDQPWSAARLEQRVARVWRKAQTQPVTVLHLLSRATIEQRLASAAAHEVPLSESVLDGVEARKKVPAARDDLLQKAALLFPADEAAAKPAPRAAKAFIARSNPIVGKPASAAPSDPPKEFCRQAAELLHGALISCEERFPARGDASILLLVVEGDLAGWRERLRPLEQRILHASRDEETPLSVLVELVSPAAAESIRRLAEAGVVTPSIRSSRVLFPPASSTAVAPLSAQELTRARQARDVHARKVKMARVLAGEEMVEEARAATTAAILEMGRALAIEHRLPEPATALGALSTPLDAHWTGGEPLLMSLRTFLIDEQAPVLPTLAALGQPTETGARAAKDFFAGIKAKIARSGA